MAMRLLALLGSEFVSLSVFAAALDSVVPVAPLEPSTETLMAHRGEAMDAPENTMSAFRLAVERGFGFECDVRLSADKVLFMCHDSDLTRTTAGACRKRGDQMTWEELSKLDVGGWGKWKGSKFSPERPPLFSEVLDLVRDGRWIYVEVKQGPEVVPFIRDALARKPNVSPRNVRFHSANAATCAAFKDLLPEYKTLWVTSARRDGKKGRPLTVDEILGDLKKAHADGVFIRFDLRVVTGAFVKAIREAGYEVFAWTVNKPDQALLAFERGVQVVATDCAQRLLDAYRALDTSGGR